jgi:hypothetical protein
MRKIGLWGFIALVCASCGLRERAFEQPTPEEKWEILEEYYLVPGVPVSNERPLPNVLSEREVLLKAADHAIVEGVLDPSYYAYQDNPALMDAKIETPILITDSVSGDPYLYLLTAVDDTGVLLAEVFVHSSANVNDETFEKRRGFGIPEASAHYITKREVVGLIQSQFPDGTTREPIAVNNLRLGDNPHSHRGLFWYFTVGENSRSTVETSDEYVIAAGITGYRSISGGVSNRAAINLGRGSPHLNGYRMAKLDTPIRLFEKLETARAAGGASFVPESYPTESVGFTPVPLK